MRPSSMVTRCIVESNQTTEHSRASNATVGARMEICYTMVFNEKKKTKRNEPHFDNRTEITVQQNEQLATKNLFYLTYFLPVR